VFFMTCSPLGGSSQLPTLHKAENEEKSCHDFCDFYFRQELDPHLTAGTLAMHPFTLAVE
jgi:hypothetical protein